MAKRFREARRTAGFPKFWFFIVGVTTKELEVVRAALDEDTAAANPIYCFSPACSFDW